MSKLQELTENVKSWQDMACAYIEYICYHRRTETPCFTAGHVTKYIRENYPQFRFSQENMNNFIQNIYRNNGLKCFDPSFLGNREVQMIQVAKKTQNGDIVYVYGPSWQTAYNFPCDVVIPSGESLSTNGFTF